jgi:hypothetical protein
MRYNRFYHPAYLWGRWIAFIGIIFIAIAYFARDFIPMAMQPALVGIVVVLVIGEASLVL